MSKVCAELIIQGRVQGVFYRQSTKETALRLGLNGWVKNRADGSVAALFEGDKAIVEQAIAWCRQGPAAANVSDVNVNWLDYEGAYSSFEVRY